MTSASRSELALAAALVLAAGCGGDETAVRYTLRFDGCLDPARVEKVGLVLTSETSELRRVLTRSTYRFVDGFVIRVRPSADMPSSLRVTITAIGVGDRPLGSVGPLTIELERGRVVDMDVSLACFCRGDPSCGGPTEDCGTGVGCGGCSAMPEDCSNSADDDCDMQVDCCDSDCGGAGCSGVVTDAENAMECLDGRDNDCDRFTDCADSDCFDTTDCGMCGREEIDCSDFLDDDCNGQTDCADAACLPLPTCCPAIVGENDCSDRIDNDCNGDVDDCDPACGGVVPGEEEMGELCADGLDNDCDQAVDCGDDGCIDRTECSGCLPEHCDDALDNDCNGLVDCRDPACAAACCAEGGEAACDNGRDDDCDGYVDCCDARCRIRRECMLVPPCPMMEP